MTEPASMTMTIGMPSASRPWTIGTWTGAGCFPSSAKVLRSPAPVYSSPSSCGVSPADRDDEVRPASRRPTDSPE